MSNAYPDADVEPPEYEQRSDTDFYESCGDHGVIEPGEFETATEAMMEAYGDDPSNYGESRRRSLHAHSEWLSPADAATAVHNAIPTYNRFDPHEIADMLDDLPGETRVALGREMSVAMYLWTNAPQIVATRFGRLSGRPDELGAIENATSYPSRGIGESLDEVDGYVLIRAWWD